MNLVKKLFILGLCSRIVASGGLCGQYCAEFCYLIVLEMGICFCDQGYYTEDPYNPNIACTKCPVGSTSDEGVQSNVISQCYCYDAHTLAISEQQTTCQCLPDYYGTAETVGSCQKCPLNSKSDKGSTQISQCKCVDSKAEILSDQVTTCQCQSNYYGSADIEGSCKKCPDNSTSDRGSTQITQCKCDDNNTLAISDLITTCQCKQNYYGTGITQGSCQLCPEGSTSNAASTQINQCSCADKKTVPLSNDVDTCRCQAGYYGSGKTIDSCQKCPSGSTSDVGSTDISQCKCFDHHTIALSKDLTSCQCQGGFYGDGQTTDSCKKCPSGSNSDQGSTEISSCQCYDKNTAPLSNSITNCQCKQNYFGTGQSLNSCIQCPTGSTSNQGSTQISNYKCDDKNAVSLSDQKNSCKCQPNYYGTGKSINSCKQCPSNSNSNEGSIQISDCKCIDKNTVVLSNEVKSCQCQPNYYGSGQSLNSCKKCPTGSFSNQNSTEISKCKCIDTNTNNLSEQISSCQCQHNYYGTGQSLNSCKLCPSGSISDSASTEIAQCKCSDKNTLNLSNQITACLCKPNYYGTALTDGSCKQCPDTTTSDSGSIAISQCKCADNNTVQLSNEINICQCKPNYYGTGLNTNSCQQCPKGSFSNAGSTLKSQCKCADSKFAQLSDTITSCQCTYGFYGKNFTANSCQECPIGSNSNLGAKNISDCTCADQYTDPLSDTNTVCLCKIGYYGSGKEPYSCKQCPEGLTTYSSGSNNIIQCVSLFCATIPQDEESQKSWCQKCLSEFNLKLDSSIKLCYPYITKALLLSSITYLIIIIVNLLL